MEVLTRRQPIIPTSPAGTYTISVKDANGCIFDAPSATINGGSAATAIAVTPVDATCGNNNGSITLGAVTGGTAPFTYSFNGSAYTSTTFYNNLAAGTYTISVNDADGCVFNAPNVIIAQTPTPSAPTTTQVDPTCTVATGTITVTSSIAGLTFSLDAAPYAAYPAGGYTAVTTGPHTLSAQNAAGCISAVQHDDRSTTCSTCSTNAQPRYSLPALHRQERSSSLHQLRVSPSVLTRAPYQPYCRRIYRCCSQVLIPSAAQNAAGCVSAATTHREHYSICSCCTNCFCNGTAYLRYTDRNDRRHCTNRSRS